MEKTARAAVARGVRTAQIWHSDKLRARQTAEILARLLASQDAPREIEGLAPNDNPAMVQLQIHGAPDPIMMVGHLPHLSRLASLLVTGDPEKNRIEFPTAAIVRLSGDLGNWKVDWTLAPDQS